jgi:hypothetical protein
VKPVRLVSEDVPLALIFEFDGIVVGLHGSDDVLRSDPQAVPAVESVVVSAGLTAVFDDFVKKVGLADKSQANDSRANVESDVEFVVAAPDSRAPPPSAVGNDFHRVVLPFGRPSGSLPS